jgi:hypothetical protein
LNNLSLRLERICLSEGPGATPPPEFEQEYGEILRRYDNHENVDFMFMKLQKRQHYDLRPLYPAVAFARYAAYFVPYIVLLCLEFVWIYKLVTGTTFA